MLQRYFFFKVIILFIISFSSTTTQAQNRQYPDTAPARHLNNTFDSIAGLINTKKLSNTITNLLTKSNTENKVTNGLNYLGINPYLLYNNKIISKIYIQKLQPFGPTIQNPTRTANSWFEKNANNLHFSTLDRLIKKNLLIAEGEVLNPNEIADNERILRNLPYLEDARIIIEQSDENIDWVEITVFVKDVWPYGIAFNVPTTGKGNIDIWNSNIFGSGQTNKIITYWDQKYQQNLGVKVAHKIPTIGSSFIRFDGEYIDRFGERGYNLKLTRPYYSPATQIAGGFETENRQVYKNLWTFDSVYTNEYLSYKYYDAWLSSSYNLKQKNLLSKYRTSIVLASRFYYINYNQSVGNITQNSFQHLQDRILIINSLSLVRQNFYKSNLIYSFGRTEDIPFGYRLTGTTGIESTIFKTRIYLAANCAIGRYHYKLGYAYINLGIGTYVFENQTEQTTIRFKKIYFSHLLGNRSFRFRIFNQFKYYKGIGLYNDQYVSIERDEGIFGLSSELSRGTEKITNNFELVMFTPWKPLGFRLTLFAFNDLGISNNSSSSLFKNELYSNLGVGFRIKNENLVINTIQFKIAYFLNEPNDAGLRYFELSGEPRLRGPTLYGGKPEVIKLYN